MTLIDKSLAERVGVQFTGRAINFASVSGHVVKTLEAVILELEIEGEALKYEAVAVAEIPESVREVLRKSEMDENVIVGLLTIESQHDARHRDWCSKESGELRTLSLDTFAHRSATHHMYERALR